MSDMEETEGTESTENPVAPHRVIGTPPPSPRLKLSLNIFTLDHQTHQTSQILASLSGFTNVKED